MKLKTPEQRLTDIRFDDESSFNRWLEIFGKDIGQKHHLALFIGRYKPDKEEAVEKLQHKTNIELVRTDFHDLVSKTESETFRNIAELFSRYIDRKPLLYFENGDKLCGAYTGFTHSKVKYATPQERYFIQKAQEYENGIIIDISEKDNADLTLRRAAHSIVQFSLPNSPLKRFLWHLKNYSLHGYDIKSKRPEDYADTSENF